MLTMLAVTFVLYNLKKGNFIVIGLIQAFFYAVLTDLIAVITINLQIKMLKNSSQMNSFWGWLLWLIIAYMTYKFNFHFFFWGVVMSAIISVALQSLVDYQKKIVLTRKATNNILAFCAFSMSLFIAYFLTEKLFFNLYLVANNPNWSFAVKVLITLELVVIVLTPVLFFSSWLAQIIVKYLKAIARYNREKPNLIKP